jgi:hypothetical protein
MEAVWVFNGMDGTFPAAVFSSREKAEAWITCHRLSGTLTRYPIDEPIYEWAIARGYFKPMREYQSGAAFIQRFSSASQEHYHYEGGGEPA